MGVPEKGLHGGRTGLSVLGSRAERGKGRMPYQWPLGTGGRRGQVGHVQQGNLSKRGQPLDLRRARNPERFALLLPNPSQGKPSAFPPPRPAPVPLPPPSSEVTPSPFSRDWKTRHSQVPPRSPGGNACQPARPPPPAVPARTPSPPPRERRHPPPPGAGVLRRSHSTTLTRPWWEKAGAQPWCRPGGSGARRAAGAGAGAGGSGGARAAPARALAAHPRRWCWLDWRSR